MKALRREFRGPWSSVGWNKWQIPLGNLELSQTGTQSLAGSSQRHSLRLREAMVELVKSLQVWVNSFESFCGRHSTMEKIWCRAQPTPNTFFFLTSKSTLSNHTNQDNSCHNDIITAITTDPFHHFSSAVIGVLIHVTQDMQVASFFFFHMDT